MGVWGSLLFVCGRTTDRNRCKRRRPRGPTSLRFNGALDGEDACGCAALASASPSLPAAEDSIFLASLGFGLDRELKIPYAATT